MTGAAAPGPEREEPREGTPRDGAARDGAPTISRGRQAFQWLSLAAMVGIPILLIAVVFAPRGTCACSPTPAPAVESPVEGVVVFVDAAGLTDVRGFRLQLRGGSAVDFKVGILENPTEFTPSHLAEHMATSEPVRVYFRPNGAALEVYRLEDASD